ncbi:hypothetical protein TRFO_41569 [Tritrichomonas foetus]|uniref:J domain-containing protein n=1 Tax=Tritrichomonas foetus TaxID=1144522 RepID=A0A1J4KZU3_9EUKA|nr:hypothetical protein TRFO_41569 [Tritrichomonas foetus]|eukprot:OHT16777.1 hypothetical protein TRFO_41569 [Tritrichomonas foetus]
MLCIILAFRFWQETPRQKIEKMIKEGEIQSAFIQLSDILNNETDSLNPIYLEMRAHCAMLLSMATTAILDLTQLLSFEKLAKIERDHLLAVRAAAYLRIGDYESALKDGQLISNKRLENYVKETELLLNQKIFTTNSIKKLLQISPESPKVLSKATQFFLEMKDYDNFLKYSQILMKIDPTNINVVKERSSFLLCNADFNETLKSLSICPECDNIRKNTTYLVNFIDSVQNRDINEISKHINHAKFIVDSTCQKFEIDNELSRFIKLVNSSLLRWQNRLDLAFDVVEDILSQYPDHQDALLSKADILFDAGDFESAAETYKIILEKDPTNFQAADGLQKAQYYIKQQMKMSPFQVIGVSENSDINTIRKAYKKLAIQWHPDNFKNKLFKNIAEKKMKRINSAFEQISFRMKPKDQQQRRNEQKNGDQHFQRKPKNSHFNPNSNKKKNQVNFDNPENFYKEWSHPFRAYTM